MSELDMQIEAHAQETPAKVLVAAWMGQTWVDEAAALEALQSVVTLAWMKGKTLAQRENSTAAGKLIEERDEARKHANMIGELLAKAHEEIDVLKRQIQNVQS